MIPGGESPDDFETRFWLSTVAAGGWITILMGLSGGIYTVFFAAEAHRLGVGVMTAVTIAVGVLAPWGAESPLALPLFLPAVFASLAYPRRLVVVVAVLAEAAFLALTFLHVSDPGYVLIFCSVLAGAAVMAALVPATPQPSSESSF